MSITSYMDLGPQKQFLPIRMKLSKLFRRQLTMLNSFFTSCWEYISNKFSAACFGIRVSVTFHLTCVHIILVLFGLLSCHLLGNSCSLGFSKDTRTATIMCKFPISQNVAYILSILNKKES